MFVGLLCRITPVSMHFPHPPRQARYRPWVNAIPKNDSISKSLPEDSLEGSVFYAIYETSVLTS